MGNHEPIPVLSYARPEPQHSWSGTLALMLAILWLFAAVYWRAELAIVRRPRFCPPLWHIIDRYAWIPALSSLGLALFGVLQPGTKRLFAWLALGALGMGFILYAMPSFVP